MNWDVVESFHIKFEPRFQLQKTSRETFLNFILFKSQSGEWKFTIIVNFSPAPLKLPELN